QMTAFCLSIYWRSEDALDRDWRRSGLDGLLWGRWRLASVAGTGEPGDLAGSRLANVLEFNEKHRLESVSRRHRHVFADRVWRRLRRFPTVSIFTRGSETGKSWRSI